MTTAFKSLIREWEERADKIEARWAQDLDVPAKLVGEALTRRHCAQQLREMVELEEDRRPMKDG